MNKLKSVVGEKTVAVIITCFIGVAVFLLYSFVFGNDEKKVSQETATPEQKRIVADIVRMLNQAKAGNEIGKQLNKNLPEDVKVSLRHYKFETDDVNNNVLVTTDNYFYVKCYIYIPTGQVIRRELLEPEFRISTVSKDFLKWDEIEFSNGKGKIASYNVRDYKTDINYVKSSPSPLKCMETIILKSNKKKDFCGYEILLDGTPVIKFKKNGAVLYQCNVSASTMLKIVDVVGLKQRMDLLPKNKLIDDLEIVSEEK